LLGFLIGYKFAVALFCIVGVVCLNLDFSGGFSFGLQWPEFNAWTVRLSPWDAGYCLQISKYGYNDKSSLCAFYPLWPGLIYAFSALFHCKQVIVGLWLSNILSVAGLWLFGKLILEEYGQQISRYSLCFLLAFPGAFFFCIPYTESLFFLLVMLVFHALHKERWSVLVVATFLLPLTRAVGIFVLVPLGWFLWEQRKSIRYWLVLLAPLSGYATYFGIMYFYTGNALSGFEAQKAFPHSPSIGNIFDPVGFWNSFVNIRSIFGMRDALLDRLFFLLLLILLPFVWKLNRTWFFYTLLVGVVPALTNWFMSYRRYIMVCFPIFVVLALQMQKSRHKGVYWYYIALLVLLQIATIILAVNYRWFG